MRRNGFDRVVDCDEFKIKCTDDGAFDMDDGVIYVVADYWRGRTAVGFVCPCGCGEFHIMPTHSAGERPNECSWELKRDGDEITLSPSLLNTRCGAHFFLRQNRVDWV